MREAIFSYRYYLKLRLGSCSVWRGQEYEPSPHEPSCSSARGAACGARSVWGLNNGLRVPD